MRDAMYLSPSITILRRWQRLSFTSRQIRRGIVTKTQKVYRPLDSSIPEIRLFVLEPSPAADSPLVGHLQTVSLDSPPPYEGLSYMWGRPNHTKPINLSGQGMLHVTPNLDVALRGLRLKDTQRFLWVDSLCINQSCLVERGQQVGLMNKIYSNCTRDLLWLGPLADVETKKESPTTEQIRKGFEVMKRLAGIDVAESAQATGEGSEEQFLEIATRVETILMEGENEASLGHAFEGPEVWRRLWVMQELSLAPKIQLVAGPHTLDWDIVSKYLGDTEYADSFHGTYGHDIIGLMAYIILEQAQIIDHQRRIMADVARGNGESKLFDVLARFRGTLSTDPRDKIFGLLGLVTDYPDIEVNYVRSPAQVYADVTASLINHDGNLDIVCQSPWKSFQDSKQRREMVDNLPTWAADFLTDGEVHLFAQRSIFNAGRASCEVPCQVLDGKALRTRGVIIGQIGPVLQDDYFQDEDGASVGNRYQTISHHPPALPLDWMRLYLGERILLDPQPGDKYITGESLFTAFWRTLVADCVAYPMMRLSPQMLEAEDKFLRNAWLQMLHDDPAVNETVTRQVDRVYFSEKDIQRMWLSMYEKWTFTVLRNGLFAMVIPPSKQGDVIACLDGAKVPVVLRPVQQDGVQKAYQLITVAYVHGVMDTEAMLSSDLREKLKLKDEDLWLV